MEMTKNPVVKGLMCALECTVLCALRACADVHSPIQPHTAAYKPQPPTKPHRPGGVKGLCGVYAAVCVHISAHSTVRQSAHFALAFTIRTAGQYEAYIVAVRSFAGCTCTGSKQLYGAPTAV